MLPRYQPCATEKLFKQPFGSTLDGGWLLDVTVRFNFCLLSDDQGTDCAPGHPPSRLIQTLVYDLRLPQATITRSAAIMLPHISY